METPEQFRVRGKRARAHPYLGDSGLDRPGSAAPEVTAEEEARGFIVFSKPPSAVINSDFLPAKADRVKALTGRDCPGQYGPITFTVFALRDGEFSVAVTKLTGPGGKTIGAKNFDVRAIRCVKVEDRTFPLLIEAFDKKAVSANRLQQFWITYYIPEDTLSGTYKGKAHILLNGKEALALPLELLVYPFKLVEPDVKLYVYTECPHTPDLFYQDLVDQRCHGMNMAMIYSMPVKRDGDLPREVLIPWLDAYKRANFSKPYFQCELDAHITCEWLNTPDPSTTPPMWGPWFSYYPFSKRLDDRYVETVRMIRDELKKRGLQLILAVADEAGSHVWTIPATKHYNDLIKREVPEVIRELTVGGGWAMGEPEHEHWRGRIHTWTTNRWLPDKLEMVRKNDPEAQIQLYNMGGPGSGPGGVQPARIIYGFFNWKAKVDGAAQWVYHHSATPEHNYVWSAEGPSEGKVPTLRWEAVREGAKDRRYLATLEKLLARKKGTIAAEARKFLDEIAERIELRSDKYDPVNGGRVPAHPPGTYDQWRRKIAEFIEKLNGR